MGSVCKNALVEHDVCTFLYICYSLSQNQSLIWENVGKHPPGLPTGIPLSFSPPSPCCTSDPSFTIYSRIPPFLFSLLPLKSAELCLVSKVLGHQAYPTLCLLALPLLEREGGDIGKASKDLNSSLSNRPLEKGV